MLHKKKALIDSISLKWIRLKLIILHPIYQKFCVPRKVKVLRKKEVIMVLFVVHELGSWKTENLYLKMMHHPRFNAKLLLVPANDSAYSYNIVKEYFDRKGYSYEVINDGDSIKKKFHPDIIFYGKPYAGIIDWRFFFANNLYALFCYVVYSFRNRNSQHLRSVLFFDFVWQLYAENDKVIEEMYDVLNTRGANMVNTGLSFMDDLLLEKTSLEDPWRPMHNRMKRIIYAPHHTINTNDGKFHSPFYYATFLEYADYMLELAEKYKDKVQWAFKPHPLLKAKLNEIWGEEKTSLYYRKWQELDNSQISEGEYLGLFKHSDAMIHDCGSFKLEYLYTDNPVLYLFNGTPEFDYENWQTTQAMKLHYKGNNRTDIDIFIQNVINEVDPLKEERKLFVKSFLTPPHGKTACDNIINAILGEEEYS